MTRKSVRPDPLILVSVVLLAAAGCGYYSTSSRTAKGIKSIAVPFFENQTTEPSLEITVTESIIQNLIDDNTLKVADEEYADAVLNGQIILFSNVPFSFNSELNAEEYRVTIKVRVSLFNRRLNEPIWSQQVITGDGSYLLDLPEEGGTFDDAVDEAIREITERILNLTVQDW
jgi:hypothetical protein